MSHNNLPLKAAPANNKVKYELIPSCEFVCYGISIPLATFNDWMQFETTMRALFKDKVEELPFTVDDYASAFDFAEQLHLIFPWQQMQVQLFFACYEREDLYGEVLFYWCDSYTSMPIQGTPLPFHKEADYVALIASCNGNTCPVPSLQMNPNANTYLKLLAGALGHSTVELKWFNVIEGASIVKQ